MVQEDLLNTSLDENQLEKYRDSQPESQLWETKQLHKMQSKVQGVGEAGDGHENGHIRSSLEEIGNMEWKGLPGMGWK
ncbi:hypothetical protein E4U19_004890 [Claviceps sp. Clav32 group G5]|nr:hypothetical protein E4U19_004890 [Claviceps sp. Clav32 group G5]KAG6052214.1 hypothetical protein E4U39_002251 [Claviceps sp. Clav50 group G5]